jgi:predicted RNA binding protein YcfA (HicA-like mRNA interferase family)
MWHLPKLPRNSEKQCISVFKTLGFEEVRQRGSHVVLKMGEAGCVVPMHHELRTGTLHGILKQAGVSREEFIEAMS